MKIGVLTLPLNHNYGGILQAYALQKTLESLNYEVCILDKSFFDGNIKRRVALFLNKTLRRNLYKQRSMQLNLQLANLKQFISEYIHLTPRFYTVGEMKRYILKEGIQIIVVGSDQVWRNQYSSNIMTYFLDFLSDSSIKRLSYAASFGLSNWQFNSTQTKRIRDLILKFSAISVREDSAITLCQKYIDIEPSLVLDPTMLLEKKDYIELISPKEKNNSGLLYYILDQSEDKKNIVKNFARILDMNCFSINRKKVPLDIYDISDDIVYPTISFWLKGFLDAQFVITDSFHGCVFSILFNKPFLVIVNDSRGNARFSSLLRMFNLQDRIYSPEMCGLSKEHLKNINWDSVNSILRIQRQVSLNFLRDNLNIVQ